MQFYIHSPKCLHARRVAIVWAGEGVGEYLELFLHIDRSTAGREKAHVDLSPFQSIEVRVQGAGYEIGILCMDLDHARRCYGFQQGFDQQHGFRKTHRRCNLIWGILYI